MVYLKTKRIGGLPGTLLLSLILLLTGPNAFAACSATGVQLQVLGSGGPSDSMGRASSAYVLWINGESKVLVDAGSGTKNNFHQSGATMDQIDLVALSHLHPDHSVELPAILWPDGGTFDLAGPIGAGEYPSISRFSNMVFGPNGIYSVFRAELTLTSSNWTHPKSVRCGNRMILP